MVFKLRLFNKNDTELISERMFICNFLHLIVQSEDLGYTHCMIHADHMRQLNVPGMLG